MNIRYSLLLASTVILAALAGSPAIHASCPANRTVTVRPSPCLPPAVRPIAVRPGCGNQALARSIPASPVGGTGNWRAINAPLRQQGYVLHRVGGNFEVRTVSGTRP